MDPSRVIDLLERHGMKIVVLYSILSYCHTILTRLKQGILSARVEKILNNDHIHEKSTRPPSYGGL